MAQYKGKLTGEYIDSIPELIENQNSELSQLALEVSGVVGVEKEIVWSKTEATTSGTAYNPNTSVSLNVGKTLHIKVSGGVSKLTDVQIGANYTDSTKVTANLSSTGEADLVIEKETSVLWLWANESVTDGTSMSIEAYYPSVEGRLPQVEEDIKEINEEIYTEKDIASLTYTMGSGSNPTISKIVEGGTKLIVSVKGMTESEYAEAGVNDSDGNTFLKYKLSADNDWKAEIELTTDSALFWWVCRGTSGEQGVFAISRKYGAIELVSEEVIRAKKVEEKIISNATAIQEKLFPNESISSYPLSEGRNDIFDLSNVKEDVQIEIDGEIDFIPSENWYLSIQSDEGEVTSYTFKPSKTSFKKTYNFPTDKTNVKVAISIYGSVIGNITASVKYAKSYESVVESVDGMNKFAYDVTKGCSGNGKTDSNYESTDGTAGFTDAISYCASNLGGKINVPKGQYLVSSPIILNSHCINIEGSIWNYPAHPNGVCESNYGSKIKIADNSIPALKITNGNGFRISQVGFAGVVSNGDTKGIFDKSNPNVNCGILMQDYHDQYEIRRVSCEGFAAGYVGDNAGMDAGVIERVNADGCNIGIYCSNTTGTGKCYYFKISNNVLSDCPAFGIYMNGKTESSYYYYGAEIYGNTLVRNGGGFTDTQLTDFGGTDECAAVYLKGLSYGSFHDNIIHNAGVFNNVSSGTIVAETQTRKFCIIDAEWSNVYGNQMLGSGTTFDTYGDYNNIHGNMCKGSLIINGNQNHIECNRVLSIEINGNNNLVQGNCCTGNIIKVTGNNNIIIVPSSYTVTDSGTGNTIIKL